MHVTPDIYKNKLRGAAPPHQAPPERPARYNKARPARPRIVKHPGLTSIFAQPFTWSLLRGFHNEAAVNVAAGVQLVLTRGSKTEWIFDQEKVTAKEMTPVQAIIARLPDGIGVRRAAELLRNSHPELEISTRDIREALLSLAAMPSLSTAIDSSTPAKGVAGRLAAHAKNFVVRHAGESGLGCYATRDIKRGERILAEAPLVEWHIVSLSLSLSVSRSFCSALLLRSRNRVAASDRRRNRHHCSDQHTRR